MHCDIFKDKLIRQTCPLSAVGEHTMNTGHKISPENIKILNSEGTWAGHCNKEALYIKEHRANLNRDQGIEQPPIYEHLVSSVCLRSVQVAQATSS